MKKDKPQYSLWSNILYDIGIFWHEQRSMIFWMIMGTILFIIVPFIGILMPKIVIDELTAKATPEHFCLVVGSMALLIVVLSYIKQYSNAIVGWIIGETGCFVFNNKLCEKLITMDYELTENPEIKKLEDKAEKAVINGNTAAVRLPRSLVMVTVNILGFLLYAGVIMLVHPLIVILLLLSAVIAWLMLSYSRKYERSTRDERAKLDRKLGYVFGILKNPQAAKDIRLYSMFDWLHQVADSHLNELYKSESKVAAKDMLSQLTDGLMILIRDGAAYAFLIYLLLHNKITLGNFVFVFAAIGTFATWVSGIITFSSSLLRSSSELSDFRTFINLPDKSNTGKGAELPDLKVAPAICMKNVGYTYPNADVPALTGINIDLAPGERIAIVGNNGAGKTTFVKLLCGLYRPTEGQITVNGIEIGQFNRDEYFTLFSAAFQDIHLITGDIAVNVSQHPPEMTDYKKVDECLKLSGLYDKIQTLPDKEKTLLVKQVNDGALELSGGEKQKLALARAIYKNAPVVILDEPTAALDPIAENEIYQKYAQITKGKTSLYISHRLASTRFCDRILFIGGQTIAEAGTHDELMRQKGKYAEMFAIQASYYSNSQEAPANV